MSYDNYQFVNANADKIIDDVFTDIDELLISSESVPSSSFNSDPDQVINYLFRDIDDLLQSQQDSSISISQFLDTFLDTEKDTIKNTAASQVSDNDQPFYGNPIPEVSPGELTQKTPNSLVTPTTPPFPETESQTPSSSSPSLKNHYRNKIILGSSCSLFVLAVLLIASQRDWSQVEISQLPDENPLSNVIEKVANPIPGNGNQEEPSNNPNAEFINYMEQASQQIHRQRRQAKQQEKSELEKVKESLKALKQGQKQLRQQQLALAKQARTQPHSSIPSRPPQPPSPPSSSQTAASPPPPPATTQSSSSPSSSSSSSENLPELSAPSASKSENVPNSPKASNSDKLPSLPPAPSDSKSKQVFVPPQSLQNNDVSSTDASPQQNQTERQSYKLVGILELESMESAALLEKAGTTKRVIQGELLSGSGWKLVNVSNETATFEKNSNQKSLSVGQTLLSD